MTQHCQWYLKNKWFKRKCLQVNRRVALKHTWTTRLANNNILIFKLFVCVLNSNIFKTAGFNILDGLSEWKISPQIAQCFLRFFRLRILSEYIFQSKVKSRRMGVLPGKTFGCLSWFCWQFVRAKEKLIPSFIRQCTQKSRP